MENAARELGADIVFLRLTNFTEFRGRKELTDIAEAVLRDTASDSPIIGHFNTDECTRKETEQRNLNWKDTFVYHPGEDGHEILANCITRLLKEISR